MTILYRMFSRLCLSVLKWNACLAFLVWQSGVEITLILWNVIYKSMLTQLRKLYHKIPNHSHLKHSLFLNTQYIGGQCQHINIFFTIDKVITLVRFNLMIFCAFVFLAVFICFTLFYTWHKWLLWQVNLSLWHHRLFPRMIMMNWINWKKKLDFFGISKSHMRSCFFAIPNHSSFF